MRVLLVEDNQLLGEAVCDHLVAERHAVDWMKTLSDAEAACSTTQYGIILLDLRLPDGHGLTLLEGLRGRGDKTPVIILTAHDQISDRISGLNAGADDYLVKPFDLGELSARMLAVSRRLDGRAASIIRVAGLELDETNRTVLVNGEPLQLSGREWAIFDRLASKPGRTITKDQLADTLYAFGDEVESNTVEVYISRLRKKIGTDKIKTVRGLGYVIEE